MPTLTTDNRDTAGSFHLRMPTSILRRIEELAKQEHRTVANMIRLLLIEALDAREKQICP